MAASPFSIDTCELESPENREQITQPLSVQTGPQDSLLTVRNLHLSGLYDLAMKDEVVLYLRRAAPQILNEVNRAFADFLKFLRCEIEQQPCVDVYGHSGNGKSTELFAVFQLFRSSNKLWVAASKHEGYFNILLFRQNMLPLKATISLQKLLKIVESFPISTERNVSLVVFDGVVMKGDKPFRPLDEFFDYIQKRRLFVVRCTSGGASKIRGLDLVVYSVKVPGFLLSEYFDAKEALKELNSVLHERAKSTFPKWYYVVGGHARYFFLFRSLKMARDKMLDHIQDVPASDYKMIAEGQITGIRALMSHNLLGYTLTSTDELKLCVVSQFVLHCFIHNIASPNEKLQLIERARTLMIDNRSYQGWLFMAEVVTLMEIAVQSQTQFQLISEAGLLVIAAPLSDVIHYNEPSDLNKYGSSGEMIVWQAYVPRAWYNYGFDAIIIKFRGKCVTVYVLQCSIAKTHDCKLKNVDIFLKAVFCKRSGDGPDMWLPRPRHAKSGELGLVEDLTGSFSSSAALPSPIPAQDVVPFSNADVVKPEQSIKRTKEEQAKEDYKSFDLPSDYEEDSEPELSTDKNVVAPTFYEKFARGVAVRTRKVYRRMVGVPQNEWFPGVNMTIHYCAVVPQSHLSTYNHSSPTKKDVELLQKHDQDFEYSRSFHRATLNK